MKKFLIKIISFFQKDHLPKYLLEIFLFMIVLGIFFYVAVQDVVSNVLGAIIGFLFSTMLLYIFKVVIAYFEDFMKVSYDTEYILDLYDGDPNYRKILRMNGTEVTFAYAENLVNNGYTFRVVDQPKKFFKPDDFIMNNYSHILSAHANSVKINSTTIRLDDFKLEGNEAAFYLSRSTVFNHLVTNRAVDFDLFEDITLRDVYEYGPRISTYADSKMSNHIGINALVFLSDGRLLVPRRSGTATISKNQVTSSIAVKLDYPLDGSETITSDYLIYGNIIDNLITRVKLDPEDIDLNKTEVRFLGFGQNLYEGGKPQFYYSVHLNNIDTDTYFHLNGHGKNVTKLDVDKCIYVVDYSTYRFKKDTLSFNVIKHNGKSKKLTVRYELSYLCNLWHYEQDKKLRAKREGDKTAGEHEDKVLA